MSTETTAEPAAVSAAETPPDAPDAPDAASDAASASEPAPAKRRRRRRGRMHDRPLKPLDLTLTGFAPGGRAVAHAPDGRVVFVEYGIPGERVIAEVTAEKPSFMEATTVMVLDPSPARIRPRCPYFGRCGGCQLQHIAYGEQLRLKTGVVIEQLRRIGRFESPPVRDMIGMSNPWEYRNQMRFTVRRDGDVGFMERGTHRFLRIARCDLALPSINRVLRTVQGRTMQTRQIQVRCGEVTGNLMVQPRLRWRPGRRSAMRSGQTAYRERLLGHDFQVSAAAFFQVNGRQAERLATLVIDHVRAARPRTVVDAYAGVGTFAAMLAAALPDASIVTIEESAAAGDDAAVNLAEYPNVERLTGTVEALLPGLASSPDVVIVDPPRIGVQREVLDAMIASTARTVIYVSCDPATLARDLRLLADGGFRLREVQPIDMFPHTQHIECVSTLDREPAAP